MANPTRSLDTTIPVGSTVKIIDSGECYGTYDAMARYMGLPRFLEQSMPARHTKDGEVFTVIAKALHERQYEGELLGLVDAAGREAIMNIKGVELVSQPRSLITLAEQVATLEANLKAITTERDALKADMATLRRILA